MLSPLQVIQLRADPGRASLGGHHLHSLELSREDGLRRETIVFEEKVPWGSLTPPAVVLGSPNDVRMLDGITATEIRPQARELHRVSNARVIGWSALLDGYNRLGTWTSAGWQFTVAQNLSNADGFLLSDAGTAIFAGRPRPARIPGTGLFFPYREPTNYGAFLARGLPLLLFLKAHNLPDFDFYIFPARTLWAIEAVRMLGLPERPIYAVSEVVGDIIDDVYFIRGEPTEGFYDDTTMTRLPWLGVGRHPVSSSPLYISRRLASLDNPTYRPLVNEPEVEAVLVELGFSIVSPEIHSFSEQIRLFSEAPGLLGPSGSGLLNAVFSLKGSPVVDIDFFNENKRQHAKIYSSTGKPYAFVWGSPVEGAVVNRGAPWRLDLALLREAASWLRSQLN